MRPSRNSRTVVAMLVITSLLLPMAYVGSYLAVTKRLTAKLGGLSRMTVYCVPTYSQSPEVDSWLQWIFNPLNELDRKIRSDYWQYDEYYDEAGNIVTR